MPGLRHLRSCHRDWIPRSQGRSTVQSSGDSLLAMKGQPCQGWGPGRDSIQAETGRDRKNPEFSPPAEARGSQNLEMPKEAQTRLLNTRPLQSLTTHPLCAHPVLGLGEYEGEVTTRVLKKTLCASSLLKAFIFYCLNNLPPYYPTLSQFYR